MNLRDQYNEILADLFEKVIPELGFTEFTPSHYNRVRKMCKIYGVDIMKRAVEQFSLAVLTWSKKPELRNMREILNYFQGIAKKELLNSVDIPDKINVGDIFKNI